MEKKFSGKIWKFGNDIDTDTIIPGKRGTIPDRNEMKKYAFELLKPEFGSTVQPGDILVAGTNFGCGSSREQAATVLSYNGVRCIIAKSFARIFFRNAFNSGILLLTCDQIQDVCEGGDIVTVDVDAQTVSVNGKTFKVGAVPENLYNIVANGGLIEDTKKRLAAGNIKTEIYPLSIEQCRKKGYTMVEKLLKKNAGKEHVAPGDIVITKPDMFMVHDIYTTYLLETMKQIGADKIDDPDNTGHSQVTKLRIIRAEKDSRGNQRNNPWYIEIENGKGIAVKNSKGGTYMKSNSFSGNGKASANLNDLEMFRLLCKTVSYIDAWEKAIGPSLIIQAKNIIKKNQEDAQRHNTSAA